MLFNNDFFKTIQREYQNGRLFAFYSLRENKIRGTFIDSGNIISEIRDQRIDDLEYEVEELRSRVFDLESKD